jgi:simple sugar transport system ATP-binding protein
VHRKEVVGIAGIEGNGQQELIEVLSKIKKLSSGRIEYLNKNLDEQSTYDVRQKGFGVIHADRHREGCVLDFSIWENFVFGHHLEEKFRVRNILSFKKIIAQIMPFFGRFEVRPAEPKRKFSSLSGGNQQKVVVARELNNPIQFLLAAHPTRGVDIGAIEKIHQLILKLRDEGSGVLLISSELDEIFSLSDRILVIQNGKIVFETTRENAKELEIGKYMTGGEGHVLSH